MQRCFDSGIPEQKLYFSTPQIETQEKNMAVPEIATKDLKYTKI